MSVSVHVVCAPVFLLVLLLCVSVGAEGESVEAVDSVAVRTKIHGMFTHAYDSYMKYAYPQDELLPLSCSGHDTWGSYSLTLIDGLDTLLVLGNSSEFINAVQLITHSLTFDKDFNSSVFESNIRVVGYQSFIHFHSFIHTGAFWPQLFLFFFPFLFLFSLFFLQRFDLCPPACHPRGSLAPFFRV